MTMLATLEPTTTVLDEVKSEGTNETNDQQEEIEEISKTPEQIAQQVLVERIL